MGLLFSLFGRVHLFVTPWAVAHQAPLSMGFSRQESWSLNLKWSVSPTDQVRCGPGSSVTDQGSPCESGRSTVADVPLEACLREGRALSASDPPVFCAEVLEVGCEVRGGDGETKASLFGEGQVFINRYFGYRGFPGGPSGKESTCQCRS